MQRCTNCGVELPDHARFCRNCGHDPRQVGAGNAQSPDEWLTEPDAAQQGLPRASEQAPEDPVRHEGPQGPQSPAWPPPAQNPPYPQPSQPPPPWQVIAQAGGPQPPPSATSAATPRRRVLGMPLSIFIVVLVCLLVLAGATAVLAYVLRSRSAGTGPALTSSPTSLNNGNLSATACAGQGSSCANPALTPTKPPVAPASTNLTLTGGVNGRLEVTKYNSCGRTSNGAQYGLSVQAKLGGNSYAFVLSVRPYNGPGFYAKGKILGALTQQPVSFTTNWINTGSQEANATVNPDNKSGTLNVNMQGTTSTVHLAGSWRCP